MSLGLRPTALPSGILIHPAIWPQHICVEKLGASSPFGGLGAQLGPNLTQCGQGRGYRHAKFHLNPSNHLATIHQRYRQTDRQRSDSIGRTILQTVTQKRFALCYRTVVLSCLSCLSVCNFGVLLPSGCMDQNETWHGGRLGPGHIVLDGDRASPPPKG